MTAQPDTTPTNLRVLPGEGSGRLTTPSGDHVPVRTFKRGRDVVLVVMVDVDELERQHRIPAADLEYNSLRGVVRLHGEAVFEDRSLIRFQARGEPEVMQRRSFVRVSTPQAVTLEDGDGAERSVHIVDLSGGGMLVSGAPPLSPDETVGFSMGLGDGQPAICGRARVIRISADDRHALVFEQIDEADRQRLIRFVFECMRTARARTRGDHL